MPCNQTLAGIPRDCEPSMGGLKRVLLANLDDVTSITVSDDIVSAITMATSAKFKEYNFAPNTASITSTYQISTENGSKYVQSDLVMVFPKMNTARRVEVTKVIENDLVAIAEDMNGKYWLLGKDGHLLASAGEGGTGTARGDRNGFSVTLQDNSLVFPYEVDEDIIANLL